jgi:hypothetical protein
MHKYILTAATALLYLAEPVAAGIKQKTKDIELDKQSKSLSLDQVKICSAINGDVLVDVILKLEPGNLVSFTLPNNRIIIGEVTRVTAAEDKVTAIGRLFGEERAGFGFVFEKEGTIGGSLIFQKSKEIFRLRFNESKNTFYLKQFEYTEE